MKTTVNVYVIVLLKIWTKQDMNLFYKYEHKNKIKINFLSNNKLKLNQKPRG